MSDITIRDGRIIRPGFYRDADESGTQYAERLKNDTSEVCTFCPEGLIAHDIPILEQVGSAAYKFYVFNADPPYSHFDAQVVLEHRLIVPESHVEDEDQLVGELGWEALQTLREYIFEQKRAYTARTDGAVLQDYARTADNPSKSVGHLHTHLLGLGLNPVDSFVFERRNGVTALEFVDLEPEQRQELINTRYKPE